MKNMWLKSAILAVAGVGLLAGSALATPIELISNGDFDAGLSSWVTHGDVSVANAGPFASAQGMNGNYALLGLHTTSGNSTLRQDFDVTGIDEITVSFNWAFDYWDNSYSADDTFLSFVRQDGNPAMRITMVDLQTQGTFWNPDINLAYGTFSQTYDISGYTTDEARLIFRLKEEADNNWLSGTASLAGIDNVSITGTAPVPEPATMLLFGTGLAGLAGVARRKKK